MKTFTIDLLKVRHSGQGRVSIPTEGLRRGMKIGVQDSGLGPFEAEILNFKEGRVEIKIDWKRVVRQA
jgi:hypothetical protein